jgi:hypothetical protein
MHGDDDQIVPIGASALLSSKLIKNAQLKVYKGGSHGICDSKGPSQRGPVRVLQGVSIQASE